MEIVINLSGKISSGKMEDTERDILLRARQGQEGALREIIEKHEHHVAAAVTGILGNGPEVDDVGQETFVHFFRSLHRFRGDAKVGTYLTRIAINLSLNELKRRKRYSQFFGEDFAGDSSFLPNQRNQESSVDTKRMVRDGLQQLPPEFRAVIVLRLINGYSTRETAEILGLPHGTVLSRLARGQAKLRQIVKDMSRHKSFMTR